MLATFTDSFRRFFATNAVTTSFDALIPTATEPTGDGVIKLDIGTSMSNNLLVAFFGSGSDNNTFLARFTGWKQALYTPNRVPAETVPTVAPLWIPVPLYQFTVTLSQQVGVSGAVVTDTDRFADTIAITLGNELTDVTKISPADSTAAIANVIGNVMFDVKGFSKLQMQVNRNSSASSGNGLYVRL